MFTLVTTSPLGRNLRSEEELPQMLASMEHRSRIEGEESLNHTAVSPLLVGNRSFLNFLIVKNLMIKNAIKSQYINESIYNEIY
jgi:hypothetical protein